MSQATNNSVRNLVDASEEEKIKFLNSFDKVFFDIDGVLWVSLKILEGAPECVAVLRDLNKQIMIVTNNALVPTKMWEKRLAPFNAVEQDMITPTKSVIWHLKKIGFNKEAFVIASKSFRNDLENAGFKIVNDWLEAKHIEESIPSVHNEVYSYTDEDKIGAVIIDIDLNFHIIKLQKAYKYLLNKDVLFLCGATDKFLPFKPGFPLVGSEFFIKALEDISQRKPIILGKPGDGLKDMLLSDSKIKQPNRVLFVGDSIPQDIAFATKCGFQKLLVLTGITKRDSVENWVHGDDLKPEYYVDSLNTLYNIITELKKKLCKL